MYCLTVKGNTGLLLSQPCQSELDSTCWLIAVLYGTGKPIPVVVRSKVWVCGRSLPGIAGSNPAGGMNVCLLCVVRYRSLRRTDHPSRGVLPCVVYLSVIMETR